jgi:hypothetical protein
MPRFMMSSAFTDLLWDLFMFQMMIAWAIPLYLYCERLPSEFELLGPVAIISSAIPLATMVFFVMGMLITADLLILLPLFSIMEMSRWIRL